MSCPVAISIAPEAVMAGVIASVAGISSLAAVSIICSASARVTLAGICAETVSGNSSSTVLLLNSGDPSHQASQIAGIATPMTITSTRDAMILCSPEDVAH